MSTLSTAQQQTTNSSLSLAGLAMYNLSKKSASKKPAPVIALYAPKNPDSFIYDPAITMESLSPKAQTLFKDIGFAIETNSDDHHKLVKDLKEVGTLLPYEQAQLITPFFQKAASITHSRIAVDMMKYLAIEKIQVKAPDGALQPLTEALTQCGWDGEYLKDSLVLYGKTLVFHKAHFQLWNSAKG